MLNHFSCVTNFFPGSILQSPIVEHSPKFMIKADELRQLDPIKQTTGDVPAAEGKAKNRMLPPFARRPSFPPRRQAGSKSPCRPAHGPKNAPTELPGVLMAPPSPLGGIQMKVGNSQAKSAPPRAIATKAVSSASSS